MPCYIITFRRAARKEFEELPLQAENRILRKIEGLEQDPRPPGCLKLRGQNELWRIRSPLCLRRAPNGRSSLAPKAGRAVDVE